MQRETIFADFRVAADVSKCVTTVFQKGCEPVTHEHDLSDREHANLMSLRITFDLSLPSIILVEITDMNGNHSSAYYHTKVGERVPHPLYRTDELPHRF